LRKNLGSSTSLLVSSITLASQYLGGEWFFGLPGIWPPLRNSQWDAHTLIYRGRRIIMRIYPTPFISNIMMSSTTYSYVQYSIESNHRVYLYPLHWSPFSLFASSTVANLPFFSFFPSPDSSPMISSRSPRSRRAFSALRKK